MQYNPLTALLIFVGIASLLFAAFRPVKGWYWLLKNNWQSNEKTVMEDILKIKRNKKINQKSIVFSVLS